MANDVIKRLNLAADLARIHWQLPVMAGGSNLGEAFHRRPRSRTQRLVGIDNVVPTIGGG